ncbi:MAG TPA: hypothetical protein VFB31_14760 [Pseudolabrys sp.]|nr:hypothetical protein [Pseudolabrys sp.]
MTEAIEIEIARIRLGDGDDLLGIVRLYPHPEEGGFAVYARDAQPFGDHDFWQVRGFLAAEPGEEFWRTAERAVGWAANEAEKRQ